jgi:hypothetical protein
VAALVDRASAQARFHQNSLPIAVSKVGEIDRSTTVIEEDQLATHLRPCTLLFEFRNHRGQHVNVALARRCFGRPNSPEAIDCLADL